MRIFITASFIISCIIFIYWFWSISASESQTLKACREEKEKYDKEWALKNITVSKFWTPRCQSMLDQVPYSRLIDLSYSSSVKPMPFKKSKDDQRNLKCCKYKIYPEKLVFDEYIYARLNQKYHCRRNPKKRLDICLHDYYFLFDQNTFLTTRNQSIEGKETYFSYVGKNNQCDRFCPFHRDIILNVLSFPKMVTQCIIFVTGKFADLQKIPGGVIYESCYSKVFQNLNEGIQERRALKFNFDYKKHSELLYESMKNIYDEDKLVLNRKDMNLAYRVYNFCTDYHFDNDIKNVFRERFCVECDNGWFINNFVHKSMLYIDPQLLEIRDLCANILENFDLYIIMNMESTQIEDALEEKTSPEKIRGVSMFNFTIEEIKHQAEVLFNEKVDEKTIDTIKKYGSRIVNVFDRIVKKGVFELENHLNPSNKTLFGEDFSNDLNSTIFSTLCGQHSFDSPIYVFTYNYLKESKLDKYRYSGLKKVLDLIQHCPNYLKTGDTSISLPKEGDYQYFCSKMLQEASIYSAVCLNRTIRVEESFEEIRDCFLHSNPIDDRLQKNLC